MSVQDQKPKWALHFKIDDTTWAKLAAHGAKTNLSALDIAIEMGIINQENLLTWDRDTSKIPALKIDFFNAPPPMELFQKFDYQKCRQKACMPVTEWSGNIYWAKLSSDPTGFESENSQGHWFLAPWSGLKKWFEIWKSVVAPSPMAAFVEPPQNAVPAEIVLGEPEIEPQGFEFGAGGPEPQSESKSFTGTELRLMPNLSSNQAPLELEIPSETLSNDGFSIPEPKFNAPTGVPARPDSVILEIVNPGNTPQPKVPFNNEKTFIEPRPETVILENSLDAPIHFIPLPAPEPQGEKPLRPETSSKAIDPKAFAPRPDSKPTAAPKKVEPPTGLNNFNPEVTAAIDFSSLMGAPIPPLPFSKPSHAKDLAMKPTVIQVVEVPLPPTPEEQPANMPKMHAPLTSPSISMPSMIPQPAAILNPVVPTKSIPTIPLDQLESRMRLATTQDSLAETFMGAWQNYFQQVMILLYQNNRLTIWWHNFQFTGQFNRGEVIPLDTPSVFKIVADTGHPYHGYVSQGPVNDKFFQVTNRGQYPDHLTIIPVVSADHVVAMLLGTCNREVGKGITLQKLEEEARLFSTSLMRTSNPVKKAS